MISRWAAYWRRTNGKREKQRFDQHHFIRLHMHKRRDAIIYQRELLTFHNDHYGSSMLRHCRRFLLHVSRNTGSCSLAYVYSYNNSFNDRYRSHVLSPLSIAFTTYHSFKHEKVTIAAFPRKFSGVLMIRTLRPMTNGYCIP